MNDTQIIEEKSLKDIISLSKDFQTSVNIAFDFDNAQKIKNFIPTSDAIDFLEETVLSALKNSPKRSRILIGAYGKGKSYMVLEALSVLRNSIENREALNSLVEKIQKTKPDCADTVQSYLNSNKHLLPVIINGNSSSLSQSFLYALSTTLKKNEFKNLMPETHFEAALNMLEKWEKDYPETYEAFTEKISKNINDFKTSLKNFDEECFNEFEELYPLLTSGSEFNPFSGFDAADIYEKTCKKLCAQGNYNGMFIVYDEFGKYLESGISAATIKDVKLLQDFAELADRSAENQIHLLLICHKEIENYIDILPKQKVDGWKGVSERFKHIHLFTSDYSEVYALITTAIVKNNTGWECFVQENNERFSAVKTKWSGNKLFSNLSEQAKSDILYGAYPLHPVTSYILPRLSEKIAQNERTLFTFLCGQEKKSLANLLETYSFSFFLTPEVLFDYFENQMQVEPYTSEIKVQYRNAQRILQRLNVSEKEDSLEARIIKTLALIYSLEQFERLSPSADLIFDIFTDDGYSLEEIKNAIKKLCKDFIYENVHNKYLVMRSESSIDVNRLIADEVEKQKKRVSIVEILNSFDFEKYIFPVQYNVENKMTRYFSFEFVSAKALFENTNWHERIKAIKADGAVFAAFTDNSVLYGIEEIKTKAKELSSVIENAVFIVPKEKTADTLAFRKFNVAAALRNVPEIEPLLFSEYDIVYQDLHEVVKEYINAFVQPEKGKSLYIADGAEQSFKRKADFTSYVSAKCKRIFSKTPVINNEMLNKTNLTAAGKKSRAKLIDAVLTSENSSLGLEGSGQEISFRNSALVVPGILNLKDERKYFCLEPATSDKERDENFKNLFSKIEEFIDSSKEKDVCFAGIFEILTNLENHIGLRRALIPLYLAVCLSRNAKNTLIKGPHGEERISSETLSLVAENPEDYTLRIQEWNDEKQKYIYKIEKCFEDFIISQEKTSIGYTYLANAFLRWYRALPKYSKQLRNIYQKKDSIQPVKKEYISFSSLLKQGYFGTQEILFQKIPECFGEKEAGISVADKIKEAKSFFENALSQLENVIIEETKQKLFEDCCINSAEMTLSSAAKIFCEKLDREASAHVFNNNAQKLLQIYQNAGNNENETVEKAAVVLTGLSICDWTEDTVNTYFINLNELNKTLLEYKTQTEESINKQESKENTNQYIINFASVNGAISVKTFEKTECSSRARILKDEIGRTLKETGLSISDAEKRQVLISLLEELL